MMQASALLNFFVTEFCINIAACDDSQTILEFHVLCCLYPQTLILLRTFLILRIVKIFMVSSNTSAKVEDDLQLVTIVCTPLFIVILLHQLLASKALLICSNEHYLFDDIIGNLPILEDATEVN